MVVSVVLLGRTRAVSLIVTGASSLILVLAICGAHFLGMSALTLVPFPEQASGMSGVSAEVLEVKTAAVAAVLIQTELGAVVLDGRLSQVPSG